MSQEPQFTVCVCTYNDGNTITGFFESVAEQVDDRYEIVVIDGGSDDGTREYLETQAEEVNVPMRIRDQTGTGLGQARQQAVEEARGTYLLEQVDADMIYANCLDLLLDFYLDCVDEDGPFQLLTHGLRVTPQSLHEELGGWRPYPHGFQENELTRRFFRHGYLLLLDVRTAKHVDSEFDFETAVRRYLYNYREKFRSGLSPSYAVRHLFASGLPVWRKVMDVWVIAATYVWALTEDSVDTFDPDDPLAYEIDRRLYAGCESGKYDDIRLEAPSDIVEACYEQSEQDKVYSYTDSSL